MASISQYNAGYSKNLFESISDQITPQISSEISGHSNDVNHCCHVEFVESKFLYIYDTYRYFIQK